MEASAKTPTEKAERKPCADLGEVEFDLVDVTPAPGFAGFERTHDGMFRAMEVFGGVFVFGRIAAADVSTFETETKMDPGIAHFQTFFAAFGVRGDFVDVGEVRAGRHDLAPLALAG